MEAERTSATRYDHCHLLLSEDGCQTCQRHRRLLEAIEGYMYAVQLQNGSPIATRHSPSCLALTGYSAEEFLLRPFLWFEIIHPDDRAAVREQIGQLLAGTDVAPLEHRILHRSGKIRWVRNTIVSYYDATGSRLGYDGLINDITSFKQAEEHFTRLLESSPDATVIVDAAGGIVLVNRQTEILFGYRPEELLGQSVEIFLPESFRARHAEHRHRYTQSPDSRGMSQRPRLVGMRKDGSQFPVEIALAPIQTEEGLLIAAAIRDVSQRVQAEEQARKSKEDLEKSEERFDLAVRGTDAGIWDWDLRTNHVYYSPRWKSMLGFAGDEVADKWAAWEALLHPDDRERALNTLRNYLDGRSEEYELEHRLQQRDGTYRWIMARGMAVRDADGRPYRMVGSHIDIDDRKQAVEAMRENEAQLLAAQKIQEHLLPVAPPVLPGFDIAGGSFPAVFAGGDYFDFLPMLGGGMGFIVADVAGHGFSSALLMASTHAFLRSFAQTCATISEIMTRANVFMSQTMEEDRFVTLLMARLDPRTRLFAYVNAGHPAGYVFDARGQLRASLDSTCVPLGVLPDAELLPGEPLVLDPGDVVILLTDGLLEALSPESQRYGKDQLIDVVRDHIGRPACEIVEAIHRSVLAFSCRPRPADDLTVVIIKVEPAP